MFAPELYPQDFSTRPPKIDRSKRRRNRYATVPTGVSPVVRLIFLEIARQKLRYQDVEDFSGCRRAAVKQWRIKNKPSWESIQSVLSVLGFGFVPTPTPQVLPTNLAGDVIALALKLEKNIPETWAALIDIGVEQKLLHMDAAERRAIVDAHHASLRGNGRSRKPKVPANDNTKQPTAIAS